MSSITSPSCHEYAFVQATDHHVKRPEIIVDRLIYQMFALLAACHCVAAAVVAATSPDPSILSQVPGQAIDIWADRQLIGVCCLGTFLGTVARLSFPAPELKAVHGFGLVQVLSMKASMSMACGLFISPMAVRYLDWHPDNTNVIFVSGVVAFLAELTLSVGTRAYQVWVEKKASDFTGAK